MADYCSITDIQNRLTSAGIKWAADRDGDGTINPLEQKSFVQPAITYATNLINEMMCAKYPQSLIAVSAGLGNPWLLDRAVDIASWRLVTIGGRKMPDSIQRDYEDAIRRLKEAEQGKPIPGFIFPPPQMGTGHSAMFPRAAIPH